MPLVGFLRFLKLLSSHDWLKEPLIVNLNDEFTGFFIVTHHTLVLNLTVLFKWLFYLFIM